MKSWKQKILPAILAGTLTFTYGAAVDAKSNNGNGKGKENAPGQLKKVEQKLKLKDIENHWAKRTVELMSSLQIIKGYEDQTFRPQNTVTQAEAIVMVVRLLGLENDKVVEANSGLSLGAVPFWAKGSVELALKEGLITKKESSQPNKPATRLFVTKMLVNALGVKWDGDADKASDYFKDVKDLSREDRSYLTFAVLQSLIKGYDDKTFRPNKPVTRAEMAVLIEKLKDFKEDRGEEIEYSERGTIYSIGDDTITISKDGKRTTYDVDDDVIVYIDKKLSKYSSLKTGMSIRVALQPDGDIDFIDAFTTGKVEDKDDDKDNIDTKIGWMKEIKDFTAEISDGDKEVKLSFAAKSTGYNAKIEVKTGSKTRVTSGEDAYKELKDLFAKAGMNSATTSFDSEKFIQKAVNVYDLDNEVDVTLNFKIGNKEYKYDDTYDLDGTTKVNWGSLDKVAEFNLDVVTSDESVKLAFEKTGDNKYEATVENKIGSKVVKKTGSDALDIIKKVAAVAVTSSSNVNLEKAVEKIDELYDLSGTAEVDGEIKVNSTWYTIDKKINVSPVDDVLGSLKDVKELEITFDSTDKKVVYSFENKSDSYVAKIEVTEDGVTKKTTGQDTLKELRALQELFTKSDDSIDLARIINWVDSKYELEGETKITGTVKIGNTSYTINTEKDL